MEYSSPEASAYDTWADYYDITDADRSDCVAFYRSLLSPRTCAILELGCGTGTILGAIAATMSERTAQAARMVGIDGSAGMIRIARARYPSVQWLLGDMRSPPVAGLFDLVFCCFNTLQHLLTEQDLTRAFRAVHGLLHPEGIFAFDLYQPNIAYLSSAQSDRMARSIIDARGRRLEIREDTSYDPDTRLLDLRWRLIDGEAVEAAPLAHTHYHLRQYFADDIERVIAAAGFVMQERYGDFERSAFSARSKKQIVVCGRARA